jgi:hypothetical protein
MGGRQPKEFGSISAKMWGGNSIENNSVIDEKVSSSLSLTCGGQNVELSLVIDYDTTARTNRISVSRNCSHGRADVHVLHGTDAE